MTFAKEAWPFVLPFVIAALAAWWLNGRLWAAVFAFAGLAILLFFRIPSREIGGDPFIVLAPANGVVTRIDRVEAPEIGPGKYHRIVTFLSVFNIHVQRAPVAGEVVFSRYREGRKVAAFRDDAGEVNQSHLMVLRRTDGDLVGVKQIAGLLARRVVCHAQVGDQLERGQLYGLIKFGSRVDLYLPESYKLLVEKGQKLHEGLTPVAEGHSEQGIEE